MKKVFWEKVMLLGFVQGFTGFIFPTLVWVQQASSWMVATAFVVPITGIVAYIIGATKLKRQVRK